MAFSGNMGDLPSAALVTAPPSTQEFITLGIYVGMALLIVASLLFLAAVPGRKTSTPIKDQPYESGILPSRPAKLREPVPFYLVAIFFVIFDVGSHIYCFLGGGLRPPRLGRFCQCRRFHSDPFPWPGAPLESWGPGVGRKFAALEKSGSDKR